MSLLLFDTCILIDLLRRKPEAIAFFNHANQAVFDQKYSDLAISVLTIQELHFGIRPKEEEATEKLLSAFRHIPVDDRAARLSGAYLNQYFRSHNVQSNDSLIAAAAYLLGAELVTLNLKHFPMFPNLKRPY